MPPSMGLTKLPIHTNQIPAADRAPVADRALERYAIVQRIKSNE